MPLLLKNNLLDFKTNKYNFHTDSFRYNSQTILVRRSIRTKNRSRPIYCFTQKYHRQRYQPDHKTFSHDNHESDNETLRSETPSTDSSAHASDKEFVEPKPYYCENCCSFRKTKYCVPCQNPLFDVQDFDSNLYIHHQDRSVDSNSVRFTDRILTYSDNEIMMDDSD